jgi:hypothetical protein
MSDAKIKEEENFVSAFCAIAQAEASCQCSARTARQEGFKGRNAAPSSLGLGRGRLSKRNKKKKAPSGEPLGLDVS